jgi:hypothetical protein
MIAACAAFRRRSSSNRDKPSGQRTTASPSIVKLLALIRWAAVAIQPISVMLDFVNRIGAGAWFCREDGLGGLTKPAGRRLMLIATRQVSAAR